MNVSDVFPYPVPSAGQDGLVSQLIKDYDRYDVFLINAPVAFGKSAIAKTIMNIANRRGDNANWIVPNNALVSQELAEWGLPTIQRKSQYDSQKAFTTDKERIKTAPQSIMNYWSLLANKLYKQVLVVDEAHSLVSMLQDFNGVKYWNTSEDFPLLYTLSDAIMWLAERSAWDKKAAKMVKVVSQNPKLFTMNYEWGMYRDEMTECLRVYPLSPKNNAPILWPPATTKKIFLLSATISMSEVEDLGLSRRRVKMYEAPSGIPPERRPAIYYPIGSMSYRNIGETIEDVAEFILACAETEKGKGFVHATYGVAARLKAILGDHPRILFHSRNTKKRRFEHWLASDNLIFVGSGMTEGLNLKGDLARWQIITKCPYPSLKDPAISAKRELDETWYAWVTIREILQAYGRVCRGPQDYGKTFIVDSSFNRLYNTYRDLIPKWFQEAIR